MNLAPGFSTVATPTKLAWHGPWIVFPSARIWKDLAFTPLRGFALSALSELSSMMRPQYNPRDWSADLRLVLARWREEPGLTSATPRFLLRLPRTPPAANMAST